MKIGMHDSTIWKILYGLLFVVLLPILLLLWAKSTEPLVPLPIVAANHLGVVLALSGLFIVASGIMSIMIYGEGLPMNAFPPRRHVTDLPPIYVPIGIIVKTLFRYNWFI